MADAGVLPTGAVTLLLTDVEGSTRLWEGGEEVAAVAMARHHALLDAAIALHGGVKPVEQGEGDSMVAAFTRPTDALRAALDAQRALREEPWPASSSLRVRMAVHTGEISLRDASNYQGPTIIRCARIRGIAHGGQTLISDATRGIVEDRLPDGVSLRDLGTHRLKDLGRAEHVWQLCHAELDDEFDPLLSLDLLPNNLPAQMTTLVGRDEALAELSELIKHQRMVTLTGAGGCGKTRLALHVGAEAAGHFSGGVWWVGLAPVLDSTLVVTAVASAVGVHEEHDRPLEETLSEQLRGRDILLILDNCEQVLDGAANLLQRLMSEVPGLRAVTTSREPLGVTGEVTWRVPSLDQVAAVDLFVERARQARPGFSPDETQRDVIDRICLRLDGLPLAVELAAARTRMMHPSRIAAELDDRFRLLTGGNRMAMPRQQTLEASVAWSYDLLDDLERATLRRLSVFAGGFSLESAESVCADDVVDEYSVLDLLTHLVDKSLVHLDDDGKDIRYRLLETIRQYARERLVDSGETDATRDRHLAYFVAHTERVEPELNRADGPALLGMLDTELDNLRAGLEWADATGARDVLLRLVTSLTLFWEMRGHLAEGGRWFARALAVEESTSGPDDSVTRARAVWGGAHVALYSDDFDTAFRLAPEALALAESLGDDWTRARALNTIGYAQLWMDPPGAREALERSIALGLAIGDEWAVADGWKMVSISWLVQEDHPGLAKALDELARWASRLGNKFFAAWCHAGWGLSAVHGGRFDAAREHLQTSQLLCREVGDPATGGLVVAWLAELHALTGETAAAVHDLELFLAHASATGGAGGVPHAELELAAISLGVGDAQRAREIVEARLSQPCLPLYLTWARVILGSACIALGDTDKARAELEKAKKQALQLGNPWLSSMADHQLGLLARAIGESAEAEDFQHSALSTCQRVGLLPGIVDGLEALAALALDHESPAEAARLFGAATALRSSIGLVRWSAQHTGYDADVARTEELLGAEGFAAAWAEGAALDTDDAVAYVSRARGERKRPSSGWAGLTPTEVKVVDLVAQGLTNPQVAEQLFIAPGTVKVHLSHVFSKLGVSTRAELAAAATRRSVERPGN